MSDWYFDPTSGNDTTGNGSSGTPYKTFGKCHDVCASGDSIILKDGIHTLAANTSKTSSGSAKNNLLITSESGDPSLAVINGAGTYTWTWVDGTASSGISFSDIGFQSLPAGKIFESTANNYTITFDNIRWLDSYVGGSFVGALEIAGAASTMLVQNCVIDGTPVGATLNPLIRCKGTQAGMEITVKNCSFYLTNTALDLGVCYFEGTGAASFEMLNTIISNNSANSCFLLVNTGSGTKTGHLRNNCLYSNPGAFVKTSGSSISLATDSGEITSNPLFVDAVGGDFRLRITSPCIRPAGYVA